MLTAMLGAFLVALLTAYSGALLGAMHGRTYGLTENKNQSRGERSERYVPRARVRDSIQFSVAETPGNWLPPSPEDYHSTRHEGDFSTCWSCGKARADCRRKIRFAHWSEADEWVRDLNETREYHNPVARYRCHWCHGWHMTSATSRIQRGRTEKQRRKWLAKLAGGTA